MIDKCLDLLSQLVNPVIDLNINAIASLHNHSATFIQPIVTRRGNGLCPLSKSVPRLFQTGQLVSVPCHRGRHRTKALVDVIDGVLPFGRCVGPWRLNAWALAVSLAITVSPCGKVHWKYPLRSTMLAPPGGLSASRSNSLQALINWSTEHVSKSQIDQR